MVALSALVASCGDSNTSAGPAPSLPAGCTPVASPEILPATHIPTGQTATYNTTPPSSGNHYASPAGAGGYTEPIKNETQVHNLEHGHVMVQYRGITTEQINELGALLRKDPQKVVFAPYPDMDPAIALTSWGKIQTCDAWSDSIPALVTYFIRVNRDNAPESIN
ncbi:MAG: DUF3105 domain-containing protein [Actinomycetota bacterium]